MKRLTREQFIEKGKVLHDDFYDYSLVDFVNTRTKVKIICPIHGVFEQQPNNHLSNRTCKKCSLGRVSILKTLKTEEFVSRCLKIHKGKYDYSFVNYVSTDVKVEIICKEHGVFKQRPHHHIKGANCPKCNHIVSLQELELQNFIESLGFEIEANNRKLLKGKELDIYIPSLKKAVEFNGEYWHYHKDKFVPGKHAEKSKSCEKLGIKLLHLREDLWLRDKIKMKKVISKFLQE